MNARSRNSGFGLLLVISIIASMNSHISGYMAWLVPGVCVVIAAALIWRRRLSRWFRIPKADQPILAGDELLSADGLTSMAHGTMAGFTYNLLTNRDGRTMFLVDLGHNSCSHIIAYGDKSKLGGVFDMMIRRSRLEKVVLEGDFPKYFHMFANAEEQSTVREVFAPDVMAQFVDFCRSYDFELFHDQLFISKAERALDRSDETSLTTDLETFLTNNRNVLVRL